jgi:DNA anti-recombination protein RmuC
LKLQKGLKVMNTPEEYSNHHISGETAQTGANPNINKSAFNGADIGEINSLEKVRDILFGNQMRDVDKRFARLEERLAKECTSLRDESRKRFDSLEAYIKKEIESLTEQLKNEQGGRSEALKSLGEEQKNITMALEKKLTQFDEQTSNSQRELREQILNQSKSLQDDIKQKYEEIMAVLEREAHELRSDKTDRSTLAAMFTELAIRLNSNLKS